MCGPENQVSASYRARQWQSTHCSSVLIPIYRNTRCKTYRYEQIISTFTSEQSYRYYIDISSQHFFIYLDKKRKELEKETPTHCAYHCMVSSGHACHRNLCQHAAAHKLAKAPACVTQQSNLYMCERCLYQQVGTSAHRTPRLGTSWCDYGLCQEHEVHVKPNSQTCDFSSARYLCWICLVGSFFPNNKATQSVQALNEGKNHIIMILVIIFSGLFTFCHILRCKSY